MSALSWQIPDMHAVLTLPNGVELLIHVGVDTVDMGGDGFKLLVNEGDHVKAGQPLIEFDRPRSKRQAIPAPQC